VEEYVPTACNVGEVLAADLVVTKGKEMVQVEEWAFREFGVVVAEVKFPAGEGIPFAIGREDLDSFHPRHLVRSGEGILANLTVAVVESSQECG